MWPWRVPQQPGFHLLGQAGVLEALGQVRDDLGRMPAALDLGAGEARLELVQEIPDAVQAAPVEQLAVQDHDLVRVQLEDAAVHQAHLELGVRAVALPEDRVLESVQVLEVPAVELEPAPDGFEGPAPGP